jgi:hypothetical protein
MTMNTRKTRGSIGGACALQTVDSEISHLERVLCLEIAHTVFCQTYWRSRVLQLKTAPGLVHEQRQRVERLLSLLEDVIRQ